jgi:hypothetical protein
MKRKFQRNSSKVTALSSKFTALKHVFQLIYHLIITQIIYINFLSLQTDLKCTRVWKNTTR